MELTKQLNTLYQQPHSVQRNSNNQSTAFQIMVFKASIHAPAGLQLRFKYSTAVSRRPSVPRALSTCLIYLEAPPGYMANLGFSAFAGQTLISCRPWTCGLTINGVFCCWLDQGVANTTSRKEFRQPVRTQSGNATNS